MLTEDIIRSFFPYGGIAYIQPENQNANFAIQNARVLLTKTFLFICHSPVHLWNQHLSHKQHNCSQTLYTIWASMASHTYNISYLLWVCEWWLYLQPQVHMNQERKNWLLRYSKCLNHTMVGKVRVEDSCNTEYRMLRGNNVKTIAWRDLFMYEK